MKKAAVALTTALMALLCGCGFSGIQQLSPSPKMESESASQLAVEETLTKGRFVYSYSYEEGDSQVTVTVASANGMSAIIELWNGGGYRAVLRDGSGFFVDLVTGELTELTVEEMGDIIPDYSDMRLVSRQETDATVLCEYSCKMDGEEVLLRLQEENGILMAIDAPESPSTGLCPLIEFSDTPPEDIFNK